MCTLTGSYEEQDPRDVGFALTSALAENDSHIVVLLSFSAAMPTRQV